MDDPILQLQLAFGVAILVAVVAFLWYAQQLRRQRRREEQKQDAFVAVLLAAVANATLTEVDHAEDLYLAHFRVRAVQAEEYSRLSEAIRRVVLRISASRPGYDEHKLREHLPSLRGLLAQANERLKAAEKVVPFFGTPEPEREVLEDILAMAGAEEKLLVRKLNRLAEAIRIRQETVETLGEEKGQARRYALWGLFGTIFFGVLSLLLTLFAGSG